jgi:hypothetical protein
MRRAIALVALMVGCGGNPGPTPDRWIDGIGIKVDAGAAPWASDPDFEARFLRVVDEVTAYAGTTRSALEGWTVWFRATDHVCNETATGCAYPSGLIELAALPDPSSPRTWCVESSSLAHETLHAVLGDWTDPHSSPLWSDWGPVLEALEATEPTTTVPFGIEVRCPLTIDTFR